MSPFDLDRIGGRNALDGIIDEVLAAGDEALRIQRRAAANAVRKADRSPVTEADEAVEKRVRAYLEKTVPDAAFLGEETGTGGDDNAALRWVLDPIDGTRAFLRFWDSWTVLLGLEADGEPALGIAYFPARGDLFVGISGGGAYDNGRPCRLSKVDSLDEALIGHGGLGQFDDDACLPLLSSLAKDTFTQRNAGDFANYAELLRGRADAVVDPAIKAFDVCPAAVLVREAGGRFTDLRGNETIHGGSALASNGRIHDAMLALGA